MHRERRTKSRRGNWEPRSTVTSERVTKPVQYFFGWQVASRFLDHDGSFAAGSIPATPV